MSAARTLGVYALCLAVLVSSACESETVVTKIDPKNPNTQKSEGVLFSLPETVVVSEVPLTKTASSPGTFSGWTEFFYPELTSDDYAAEKKTTFKIGAPTFTTRGQTDPQHVYMAHIKAKRFETKTLLVEFNDDGIIARTETSSKDDTLDIITSSAKAVASVVAPLLPLGMGADAAKRAQDNERCDSAAAAADAKVTAADEAAKKFAGSGKRRDGEAADKAAKEARAALREAVACSEQHFKSQLTETELSLYESLDQSYKDFLRDNFGYDFLTYLAKKDKTPDGTLRPANISFFFTLSEAQQNFIKALPRGAAPCPRAAAGTLCMSQGAKTQLIKAARVFDKIQELRQRREELATKDTPPAVTTGSNLELKLRELDNQIKALEQTYFLGTSTETTAAARFEFKPGDNGTIPHPQEFFTYAAGGAKPGICSVPDERPGVFKAVWPKTLKGECHKASQEFEAGDFRNLKGLAQKLYGGMGGGADRVTNYLYASGLPNAQSKLAATDTPQQRDALQAALITDLNGILNGGARLDGLVSFDAVKLSADTIALMNTQGGVPAADYPKLNRLLLEDAYSDFFHRQKAWAARPVALVVNAAPAGIAQAVGSANLIENGKRGFPYRVPALTLARLTDDGVEKGRGEVRIAQFGPVETLPASLGGRRGSYTITYHDASGAIKVFNMSADALIQKQNITDLTDAATTLRDAEAARLKRETDLLKARKDKIVAEKALKEAQAEPTPTPAPSPTPEQ